MPTGVTMGYGTHLTFVRTVQRHSHPLKNRNIKSNSNYTIKGEHSY